MGLINYQNTRVLFKLHSFQAGEKKKEHTFIYSRRNAFIILFSLKFLIDNCVLLKSTL
jgi:hypothetical protein